MPTTDDLGSFDLDAMIAAYVACALWSTLDYSRTDESGHNPMLDGSHGPDDIAPDTLARIREDCREFALANLDDLRAYMSGLGYDETNAGHDFWLTRERHGAGFWDRYYGKDAELRATTLRLSDAAKAYGEFGDDLNQGMTEGTDAA